jgi:hypothetical protein
MLVVECADKREEIDKENRATPGASLAFVSVFRRQLNHPTYVKPAKEDHFPAAS